MKLDRSIVRNVFTASSLAVLAMLSGCGTTGQQVYPWAGWMSFMTIH